MAARQWENEKFGDTPDERIRFALGALKQFEAQKNCKVDMGSYHDFDIKTNEDDSLEVVCIACLGGSAALKRFVPQEKWQYIEDEEKLGKFLPDNISSEDISYYEHSIELARWGGIGGLFERMGLEEKVGEQFTRKITDYHIDADKFYEQMEQLAADIQKVREAL